MVSEGVPSGIDTSQKTLSARKRRLVKAGLLSVVSSCTQCKTASGLPCKRYG